MLHLADRSVYSWLNNISFVGKFGKTLRIIDFEVAVIDAIDFYRNDSVMVRVRCDVGEKLHVRYTLKGLSNDEYC